MTLLGVSINLNQSTVAFAANFDKDLPLTCVTHGAKRVFFFSPSATQPVSIIVANPASTWPHLLISGRRDLVISSIQSGGMEAILS